MAEKITVPGITKMKHQGKKIPALRLTITHLREFSTKPASMSC